VKVEVKKGPDGKPRIEEMPGTAFEIETDLVVLALGFARPEQGGKLKAAGVELDACGNVKADNTQMTSLKGVFAAGDMRRGQSLVVWAVSEGRKTAHYVDKYLSGESCLPVM
jgi:glutamate synthase (NADPH/NADH) small chain